MKTNLIIHCLVPLGALLVLSPCSHTVSAANQTGTLILAPLSETNAWTFAKHLGNGSMSLHRDAGGDFLEFEAADEEGMAATLGSRPFDVEPGREYRVSMEIRTEHLQTIDGKMLGGVYFLDRDKAGNPGVVRPGVAQDGRPARGI
jgi:hypothetical protein